MRRFPRPWTLDEANAACFIVRDLGNAKALRCGGGHGLYKREESVTNRGGQQWV